MTDELKKVIQSTEEQMKHSIAHLETELSKIRAGKANPSMLDAVMVDYYGNRVPLSNVGNISSPDPRTLLIQPWEKGMITPIEKAILMANLGFNPQNDGTLIRISIPPLTEERRKELVKKAKSEAEHAKVSLRTIRKQSNEEIKKLQKAGTPEDMTKQGEQKVQELTDAYAAKADKHIEVKEKEIMTV
ncbi:MAG: ribosome recycling factor [Bacteroidota bacterium]|jgi:ribosome recycling factor